MSREARVRVVLRGASLLAGEADATEALRDDAHKGAVDGKAGDDGEDACAFDVALADGDEEEVVAVEDEAAELAVGEIGGPRGKAEGGERAAIGADVGDGWWSSGAGLRGRGLSGRRSGGRGLRGDW
jgi:hypothetical protein